MQKSDFKETSPGVWEVRDSKGNAVIRINQAHLKRWYIIDLIETYNYFVGNNHLSDPKERSFDTKNQAIQAACDHFNGWVRDNRHLFENLMWEVWQHAKGFDERGLSFNEYLNSLKQKDK